jgi:hypothetical protein
MREHDYQQVGHFARSLGLRLFLLETSCPSSNRRGLTVRSCGPCTPQR